MPLKFYLVTLMLALLVVPPTGGQTIARIGTPTTAQIASAEAKSRVTFHEITAKESGIAFVSTLR